MRASAIIGTVALAMAISPAAATVMDFNPTADGDVQTFGGDSVVTGNDHLTVTQSGGLARNAILEFDLSSIPDTATINSAVLMFTLNRFISQVGSGLAAIDVIAYNGDGTVDITDFAAAGTQVVDTTTPSAGTSGGDMLSFSFTSVVPIGDALAANLLTVRIETDSFAGIQIASLENTSYDAPKLTIDYTESTIPVPGALAFGLTGLAGLSYMARRKV